MTKPYRVVARLKNNRLWQAILLRFPEVVTQSDAARSLNITPQEFGQLLNMTTWPSKSRRDGSSEPTWTKTACRIAATLHVTPDYLFDAELYGRRPQPLSLEVDPSAALSWEALHALPLAPDEELERQESELEMKNGLATALRTLEPKLVYVLTRRLGLDGRDPATLQQVGDDLSVGGERIRQMEQKALRLLRHPSRSLARLRDITYA